MLFSQRGADWWMAWAWRLAPQGRTHRPYAAPVRQIAQGLFAGPWGRESDDFAEFLQFVPCCILHHCDLIGEFCSNALRMGRSGVLELWGLNVGKSMTAYLSVTLFI